MLVQMCFTVFDALEEAGNEVNTLCFNIVVLEIIFYNNETKLMGNYIYIHICIYMREILNK